jgi:inorganic triphosphatase YgiF
MKRHGHSAVHNRMSMEVEVKLEAPPGRVRALAAKPWLLKFATAPAKRQRLVSVYYDTENSALRNAGIALRVRRAGDRLVQTVKRGAAGPFGREEWEWEIGAPKPDLDMARHSALKDIGLKHLRRKLKPVFETDINRFVIPVRYRGSDIEIAMDRGQVKTGRKHCPISEIELELKAGGTGGLMRLAARIAREANGHYGVLSKAARGYALLDGGGHAPVFAQPVHLEISMTAADCFKTVALSCLHHFAANKEAVLAGEPEGVHQMRVGLRRLRTAMSLFKSLLRGRETERIKHQLKWLTAELGPARDLDVLVKDGIPKLERAKPDEKTLPALKKDLKARREHGFVRVRRAVAGSRCQKLVLETALWIAGGSWALGGNALLASRRQRGGRKFAADEMSRRLDKILKGLDKLKKLDAKERHKLRIKVKKLRYAVDFFECVFPGGNRARKFAKTLTALQTALGKLNDIRVHGKLARDYTHPPHGRPQKAFAMGLLRGHEEAAEKRLIARAAKGGRKLAGISPFWQ